MAKNNKFILGLVLCAVILGHIGCTSQPEASAPPEQTMHFPYPMAVSGSRLMVLSASSDAKYSLGRMISLSTDDIKTESAANASATKLSWSKTVKTNTMIPPDVAGLHFGDSIFFISRNNNRLYGLSKASLDGPCNNAFEDIERCSEASSIQLSDFDPYSLESVSFSPNEEMILVSYLRSDQIDLVKYDKTKKQNSLSLVKTFSLGSMLKENLGDKFLPKYRVITRKILVKNKGDANLAKVYFLAERHNKKFTVQRQGSSYFEIKTDARANGAYLISAKVSGIIAGDNVSAAEKTWNLNGIASITGVRDLYIDNAEKEAVILARRPEQLYKIDLANNVLRESEVACTGASSMAVSEALDLICVPCMVDSRVVTYNFSTLNIANTSEYVGRSPAFIAIDEKNNLIFSSYYIDGTVGIFDLNLKYLGYLFDKAPKNQQGS